MTQITLKPPVFKVLYETVIQPAYKLQPVYVTLESTF